MDEEAARTLGLKLHVLRASTERAFEPAFAALKSRDTFAPIGPYIVTADEILWHGGAPSLCCSDDGAISSPLAP